MTKKTIRGKEYILDKNVRGFDGFIQRSDPCICEANQKRENPLPLKECCGKVSAIKERIIKA